MDAKQLQKIINICKKMGVLELKFEGIEIKLASTAIVPRRTKDTKEPDTTPYTEDETLFWSSAGLPEAVING